MNANDTSKQIADTILEQLGGAAALQVMIGAKDFVCGDMALTFKWSAKAANDANCATITLDADDTYELSFCRITTRKYDISGKGSTVGLHACDLRRVFQDATKLYISL